MADRTVSVELTLKTEQYKAEVEAAKLKTEELDKKVEALDKDINKIPADGESRGRARRHGRCGQAGRLRCR